VVNAVERSRKSSGVTISPYFDRAGLIHRQIRVHVPAERPQMKQGEVDFDSKACQQNPVTDN